MSHASTNTEETENLLRPQAETKKNISETTNTKSSAASASSAVETNHNHAPEHPYRQCVLYSFSITITIITTAFFTMGFVYHKPLLGPLFIASIIPSFIIIWFAYRNTDDKTWEQQPYHSDKVSSDVLVIAFIGGIFSTLLVAIIGLVLNYIVTSIVQGRMSFVALLFYVIFETFFMIALVEESMKYLIARTSINSSFSRYITHPYGVVLFGLTAALGFAGIENVAYVVHEDSDGAGWMLAVVRALVSVPLHGTTGSIIGYGLARRAFFNDTSQSFFKILFWPVVVHGIFDCLFMLPLRNGPFVKGATAEMQTEANTVDVGDWISLVYVVNIVMVIVAIAYARQAINAMCEAYDNTRKDSAEAV